MISVKCCLCNKELDEPGALAFAPPDVPFGMVDKFHICKSCWFEKFRPALVSDVKLVPTVFHDRVTCDMCGAVRQADHNPGCAVKVFGTVDDVIAEVAENPYDVVEHHHDRRISTGRTTSKPKIRKFIHTHAWGSEPHSHMLRAICLRPECKEFETHNIHTAPDKKEFLDAAIERVAITGDGQVHFNGR